MEGKTGGDPLEENLFLKPMKEKRSISLAIEKVQKNNGQRVEPFS